MTIDKTNYTPRKNVICNFLQCFDYPLDDYFKEEKLNEVDLLIPVKKNAISPRIMNFMRLFVLTEFDSNFDETQIFN